MVREYVSGQSFADLGRKFGVSAVGVRYHVLKALRAAEGA